MSDLGLDFSFRSYDEQTNWICRQSDTRMKWEIFLGLNLCYFKRVAKLESQQVHIREFPGFWLSNRVECYST